MKDKHYRKVFIEGKEENLPKEMGGYFIHFKSKFIITSESECYIGYTEWNNTKEEEWLKEIDWYLQPISDTRDAVIEKQGELIEYYHNWATIKSQSDMKAISKLESELSTLQSESKEEKEQTPDLCCGIYKTEKERQKPSAEELIRIKFKLGNKPYPEYQWGDDFVISVKEIIELMQEFASLQSGKADGKSELREDDGFLLQHYEIYKAVNSLNNCGRTYEDIIDEYLSQK
jgi:hypothetical protein